MVRQHLKHRQDRLRQEWAQGNEWTSEAVAVVGLLAEIEDLEFDDVAEFYGLSTVMDFDRGEITTVTIPDVKLGLYPEEQDDE